MPISFTDNHRPFYVAALLYKTDCIRMSLRNRICKPFTARSDFFKPGGLFVIIKLCSRPFADVRIMDETLLANWNAPVTNGNTVYIISDLMVNLRLVLQNFNRLWQYDLLSNLAECDIMQLILR